MTDQPDDFTPQDEPDFGEAGRLIFAREAEFIWASTAVANLPPMKGLEIAFAGRSNVGKSSLVNALTGRKTLARVSHTPGRTQQLNFFDVGGAFTLVDMPGYGFAAVSKEKVFGWTRLIRDYLRGRANLARVFVLIDSRHGLKDLDLQVLDLLDVSAVSYQIILTKADAPKQDELAETLAQTQAAIARRPAAFPTVIVTSSRDRLGVEEMRAGVARLLHERGVQIPL